jgi:hypothetical protein
MTTILAYFDPGSGSMLVQALAGGTAGLLVFGKYVWDTYLLRSRSNQRTGFGADGNELSTATSVEIPISR